MMTDHSDMVEIDLNDPSEKGDTGGTGGTGGRIKETGFDLTRASSARKQHLRTKAAGSTTTTDAHGTVTSH